MKFPTHFYAARAVARYLAVMLAAATLAGCGSIQRAYWDAKVEEMCRKDGGVTVYERVKLTPDAYRRLHGSTQTVNVLPRDPSRPDAPYVADTTRTWLNEDPGVFRSETSIVRSSDGKVLSRGVYYARVGSDFIRPFGCEKVFDDTSLVGQTFELPRE